MAAFSFSPYGEARIEIVETACGLTLNVAPERPAAEFGVWLHPAEASSSRGYLARFDLHASDPVNLRESMRGNDHYASADRGWAYLVPNEAVLIYAAAGQGFSLDQIEVRACSARDWQCRTDSELRGLLPPRGNQDSLTYAVVLLEWAAQHCPYALTPSIARQFDAIDLTAAQTYFRYFELGGGAGFCAETAQFFSRLLAQEGIESFTWAFGVPRTELTHVTTIMAQSGKFYLFDPTFGGYFAFPEDYRPQPVDSILGRSSFSYREFDGSNRLFVADSDASAVMAQQKAGSIEPLEARADTEPMLYRIPGYGLDFYLHAFANQLAQVGISPGPQGFVDLMNCSTFGIGDGKADTEPMLEFARMLDSHGIILVDTPGMSSPMRLLNH